MPSARIHEVIAKKINQDYHFDERLLKIIKRSKTLSNFILDGPRSNVQLLENYIKQNKSSK